MPFCTFRRLFITTPGMAIILSTFLLSPVAWGQHPGRGVGQSVGISTSYSPDSSHILIGTAQKRRIFTAGVEYTRSVWARHPWLLDYRAEVSPIFRETDPTMVGTESTQFGSTGFMPITPVRVIQVSHTPVGVTCGSSSQCAPIYPVYGSGQTTWGALFSPLGVRAARLFGPRFALTFESDAGVVITSRDIPVDDTARWNFEFAFGPGLEVFMPRGSAIRFEYVFRHISNAGAGAQDPGIDQGVFRLTLAHYSREGRR